MPYIDVKFKNYNKLVLNISDTPLGKKYFKLVKQNYNSSFPVFRDRTKYNIDYMLKLAKEAKNKLGWNWEFESYNIEITALLHKNIEELVGTNFDSVPAELDNLIHELHYCLHIIQDGRTTVPCRDGWIQIEWYNDNGFTLEETNIFSNKLKFGDIRLQNPFVGHGPLQIYLEKDFTKISQTCKFHNFVKPGVIISISDFNEVDPKLIIDAFVKHAPEFVKLHSKEKILSYIGHPIIGHVENLNDLHIIANAPYLELESMEFNE